MNRRHFEADEFPEHCDHCPREFLPGIEYQRVQMVVDASHSVVGGVTSHVEHSFELVFCLDCAGRLNRWLQTPLAAEPLGGDLPSELDDGELESELEKELFILGDGGEREFGADASRLRASDFGLRDPEPEADRKPDGVVVSNWKRCGEARCPVHGARTPGFCTQNPRLERLDEATVMWRLSEEPTADSWQQTAGVDPDKMHGAGDPFPGEDYFGSPKQKD